MAHAMGEIARIPATDELTRSSSPGHTILSVDDNGINRYLRARTLRAAGFQVIEAENGAGALQKAAERQPSLVLLDVRLPDIDGIEVCSRLKSDPKTAAIPVIHISALGRIEEDMPRALERQSDAYLREPVEPGMLVATIQALIRAHEAEERARKAERRASEILDTIAEPVVAFDKQWRYTYLNRHAAEAFGKSPEEMIGKSIWELFPKDNRKDFEEACGRAWATGKPAACERYSATLGAWVENYIYPFENGASSQWHDITERKRAEAALRESEARLARTQEFSLVMAVHVSLDGKWLKVPPTFVRFLGYDSETELLGRPFKDFTHPEDFRADWSQVLRLKRGEIKSFEMEKRFLRKDGSPTWGYLNCSIVPDENGKPVHLLTYVRDINAQ
jgi:PAS domain S-box-containing protein